MYNAERKCFKISIDGKKISGGFGKSLGDVDLVGHEEKPTLQERKDNLQRELNTVLSCNLSISELQAKGYETYAN